MTIVDLTGMESINALLLCCSGLFGHVKFIKVILTVFFFLFTFCFVLICSALYLATKLTKSMCHH